MGCRAYHAGTCGKYDISIIITDNLPITIHQKLPLVLNRVLE